MLMYRQHSTVTKPTMKGNIMSKEYRRLKPKSPEYMEAVIVLRDSLKNRFAEKFALGATRNDMVDDFAQFFEDLDELIEEATEEI